MSHTIGSAKVKKGRLKDVLRKGRGFSRGEIKEAVIFLYKKQKSSEISLKDFLEGYKIINGVKMDVRRRSIHKSNVEFLKKLPYPEKSAEKKTITPKKKPVKKTSTVKKPVKKTSTAKKTVKKTSTAKKTAKKTSTAKKSSKKTTRKKSSKKTTTTKT